MEVPLGFLAVLWSFISFIPFFSMLLILGIIKAVIIGPLVSIIVFLGNSAVIIGLWPAHFIWTYYCVAMTKRLGLVLKLAVLTLLPLPLLMWPVLGILGSLVVGIGYGFFAPLIATFEAVGEQVLDKLYHCFADGCKSTVMGACTLVRDSTDFCFHSFFSFMDDIREMVAEDETPTDIKLSILPSCLLVSLLGVPIDVFFITMVALFKSPYMLLKGWHRLLHDLIGREGPFLETACVPFAGLAIILWPLAVIGAVVAAFICSFFLGLYGSVIVYQEDSLRMGLAYVVSAVSLFDEYSNDLLYLREGSCLPSLSTTTDITQVVVEQFDGNLNFGILNLKMQRGLDTAILKKLNEDLEAFDQKGEGGNSTVSSMKSHKTSARLKYRKHQVSLQHLMQTEPNKNDSYGISGTGGTKLAPERSRTLKNAIQQLKPFQIWDWLFRSCEINGRLLLSEGLISAADIEECIIKGKCKKLSIKLPSWCILQCLLRSAKSDSYGLLISDEVELTSFNWPKDKVLEWFLGPLLIMKEQLKRLQLDENEESCLRELIILGKQQRPEDWDDSGFPTEDRVRRAQLQALFRRLQGVVASMSRIPTFRRRFNNLVKSLYLETIETGDLNQAENSSKSRSRINKLVDSTEKHDGDAEDAERSTNSEVSSEIL